MDDKAMRDFVAIIERGMSEARSMSSGMCSASAIEQVLNAMRDEVEDRHLEEKTQDSGKRFIQQTREHEV